MTERLDTCEAIATMKGLTYFQYRNYFAAINTFLTIDAYNLAIHNARVAGDTTKGYYTFTSETEHTQYTQGRMLLIQVDPKNAALYLPVEQL